MLGFIATSSVILFSYSNLLNPLSKISTVPPRCELSSCYIPKKEKGITKKKDMEGIGRNKKNFAFGNCTYYVASKKDVKWLGDAKDWFINAKKAGANVGKVPKKGSIVVFKSPQLAHGHVAIVEEVEPDKKKMVVSEMNWRGFNVVSKREVLLSDKTVAGYVYQN